MQWQTCNCNEYIIAITWYQLFHGLVTKWINYLLQWRYHWSNLYRLILFNYLQSITYNKFREIIAYTYKIFEIVNYLLQQYIYIYIYHWIKVIIKIFGVYCNKKILLHKPITSNFIATSCINYCNNSNVIAIVFFFVAISIYSCSASQSS